jgi:coenzyme F420 hydrogenase subunit beta
MASGIESDALASAVHKVLLNDNCSGCGGCALVSKRISLDLDASGFLRPAVAPMTADDSHVDEEAARFAAACPGVSVSAARNEADHRRHPLFGRYVSVWSGHAASADMRYAGSSGGALSALAAWLVDSGRVESVIGAGPNPTSPSRTVAVSIMSKEDALRSAGSRYAPVSTLAAYAVGTKSALIVKPCEAAALAGLHEESSDRPISLAFFCAGTPTQHATEQLIDKLGVDAGEVTDLRYRGNGWPGRFTASDSHGMTGSMTYEQSWGEHLGRALQSRCKVCVDGTGDHADIAVGDYWKTDERGYPVFEDADGTSAIIARTQRGHQLIEAAIEAGVIIAEQIEIETIRPVQPLQVRRVETLLGRMLGRRAAGIRSPEYRGYGLLRLMILNPAHSAKAALGSFRRARD